MEFTKENWENAPEGARVEYGGFDWKPVTLIGFSANGRPVIEDSQGGVWASSDNVLRIILPKRKVTVQLWQLENGALCSTVDSIESAHKYAYTLLGEHTFEIEGCDGLEI